MIVAKISIQHVKTAVQESKSSWRTWAIGNAEGSYCSFWNGARYPRMRIQEVNKA